MCLTIDKQKTEHFKKNHKTGKTTVYKAFEIKSKNIYSPLRGTKANTGFFKAKGKYKKDAESVSSGVIHVFQDYKSALNYGFDANQIIKCWAYNKDLVGIGLYDGDMGFTKIFIPKAEVEKTRSKS